MKALCIDILAAWQVCVCVCALFTQALVKGVELADLQVGEGLVEVELVAADAVTEQQHVDRVKLTLLADGRYQCMQRN